MSMNEVQNEAQLSETADGEVTEHMKEVIDCTINELCDKFIKREEELREAIAARDSEISCLYAERNHGRA